MKKGFTIVELLIYIGLMGILLIVLTDIFSAALKVQTESTSSSAVRQDGRYILARLSYDVPRASAIISPAAAGQATSTAILSIDGVSYTYDGSSGNLLLGTDQLNSFGTQISNLTFTRLGNTGGKNNLQIKFRLTSRALQTKGQETKDFQITLGQR